MNGWSEILYIMKDEVRANGVVWGGAGIAARILRKIKSRVLGAVLGAPDVNLGPGCRFNGIRFMRFGRGLSVRGGLWLEAVTCYEGALFTPQIVIGSDVGMSEGVHITAISRIEVGSGVLFGSHVFVSDHNHGAYAGTSQCDPAQPPGRRALHSTGAVVIEDNVWLGDNVNVVGPVRIGRGAVIAANSVVRSDVPAGAVAAGAPARVIKVFDKSSGQWARTDQRGSR